MTGSIALDVFIGLVFIYLLYSLMATVLMEMWSSRFRLRSRNLKYTLIRMLSDEDLTFTQRIRYFWRSKSFPKSKQDLDTSLAQDFYSAPTIKFLSQKSGQLPSSIDADTFSKTMVYILSDGHTEIMNSEELMKSISAKLESRKQDPETVKHIRFLCLEAGNDIESFKALLKSWYEEMMQRCLGWYKKRVQIILLIFGFLVASVFNLNSLYLVKILTHDNQARDGIVKMAGDYAEATNNLNVDSLKGESYQELKESYTALKKQSNELNGILGLKSLPDSIEYEVISRHIFDSLGIKPTSFRNCSFNVCDGIIIYKQPDGWAYLNLEPYVETISGSGFASIDTFAFYWKYSFWGYLITALAISLGAPFWFDLLNKLMLLRSSLTKKTAAASQSNSTKPQKSAKPQNV